MSMYRDYVIRAASLCALLCVGLAACDSEEDVPTGMMTNGGATSNGGATGTAGMTGTAGVTGAGGVTMTGGVGGPQGGTNPNPGGTTGGGYVPPMDDAGRCFESCLGLFACDADPSATCGAEARAALAASCQLGCAGPEAGAINSAGMQGCAGGSTIVNAAGLICVDESLCAGVSCEPGQGCEGGVCSPWACQPDFYDDSANDTQESAYALEFAPLSSPGLTLCAGDEDWFRIDVPANSSLRVDLAFKHAEADIDAKLFKAGDEMTAFKSSTSGDDNERLVVVPSDESRTFFLRVYVYGNDRVMEGSPFKSGRYGLYVSTNLPAPVCQNSVDCQGNKLCNPAGVCVDPPPCATDEDCSGNRCIIDTGECVQCLVNEDCFSGICDMSSYSCVDCLTDTDCAESGEVCDLEGTQRCVECVNDNHCPDGVCNENSRCIPNSCTDMYEPNEDQASASAFGAGVTGAYICGDEDWYSLTLDGQPTLLTVEFSHSDGDIDAELIDPASGDSIRRLSTSDNENFGLIGRSGQHYLRVYGAGFVVSQYNVNLTVNPPSQICGSDMDCPSTPCNVNEATCRPEGYCSSNLDCVERDPNSYCSGEANVCQPCQPDAAEPNNSLMDAVPVDRGLGQELNVCGARDFFLFEAGPGQMVRLNVLFTHANGDVDVKLYAPSETGEPSVVSSGTGTMDNETIEYEVERGGLHYIEVYGFGNDNTNSYRLELSL